MGRPPDGGNALVGGAGTSSFDKLRMRVPAGPELGWGESAVKTMGRWGDAVADPSSALRALLAHALRSVSLPRFAVEDPGVGAFRERVAAAG
jgi:hypothetical protein